MTTEKSGPQAPITNTAPVARVPVPVPPMYRQQRQFNVIHRWQLARETFADLTIHGRFTARELAKLREYLAGIEPFIDGSDDAPGAR